MDNIKALESKRVLRELDFIESDYEYRQEIVTTADKQFLDSVNLFLQQHVELKEIYDNKINEYINNAINQFQPKPLPEKEMVEQELESATDFEDWNNEEVIDDEKDRLKKIYREIAKITHPDVVSDTRLNELYIKSTKHYESKNRIGLFSVCNELNIQYEINDDDIQQITYEISSYKQKINFLENTYTWRWFHTEDKNEKIKLIFDFIQQKIR